MNGFSSFSISVSLVAVLHTSASVSLGEDSGTLVYMDSVRRIVASTFHSQLLLQTHFGVVSCLALLPPRVYWQTLSYARLNSFKG